MHPTARAMNGRRGLIQRKERHGLRRSLQIPVELALEIYGL